jgi:proline iminopeptidase
MMMMSFGSMGVVSVIYVLWGYSMSFSSAHVGGGNYLGLFDNPFALFGVNQLTETREIDGVDTFVLGGFGTVPAIVWVAFQLTFAVITVALISGAVAERMKFGTWLLFGGSWGATLALAYAQAHPDRVTGLVLRGVFLGRRTELDWFYGGGAGRFFPDLWRRFQDPIPEAERGNMIAAYHRRLFSDDQGRQGRYALPWLMWENALAGLQAAPVSHAPADYARAFARLENHYFMNGCFLSENQLLEDRHLIEHLPAVIVQGRYDMVCPPLGAHDLAQGWANCDLRIVPASGHALSEPGISAELLRVMDALRDRNQRED